MTSKSIQSPYLEMKLMTNDEFQEYKNHSCEEYVRQGITFNYDKMALLNKKYLEPKSEEELETSASQSLEQENTAGNLTEPTLQNADIAISQHADNVDTPADSNSDDVQSVNTSINTDDSQIPINTSNIQETEQNKNDSQHVTNLSMTTPPADPAPATNVIQGVKNVSGQVQKPKLKPFVCRFCNKGYATNYTMNRHISQYHNNDLSGAPQKSVKRLQNSNNVKSIAKKNVKSNANAKSVFVLVPVPMPAPATAIPSPVPVAVKNPQPVVVSKNVKKRKRFKITESDDENDEEEPPSKSFITSRPNTRSTRRSQKNDEDEYHTF